MKTCKFKQLILDVYKEWIKPTRIFKKTILGFEATYNNFWGTLYGGIARDTFDKITDIDRYMDICNPDMLCLNSRATAQEVEVYEWQLKDYSIDGDKLIVKLDNKEIVFIM